MEQKFKVGDKVIWESKYIPSLTGEVRGYTNNSYVIVSCLSGKFTGKIQHLNEEKCRLLTPLEELL